MIMSVLKRIACKARAKTFPVSSWIKIAIKARQLRRILQDETVKVMSLERDQK